MKTIFTFLILLLLQISSHSQCPTPSALVYQDGNDVKGMILNSGNLFWNGYDGLFTAPANDPVPKSTIFTASLWMGGLDPGGKLKLAAQTYNGGSTYDYAPGPLNNDGTINEEHCQSFNKIWKVTYEDIELHKADFADNGIIDNPINSIYGWPGRNNFYFYTYNGFILPSLETAAPFFDQNGDNEYDPQEGDYPHPPHTIPELSPASMTWSVFNDNTLHNQSQADPIIAEVQLTSWSFDCFDNTPLSKTIFTSHKIINKSVEALDSFHVALWVDFDLGCYLDDYMGSDTVHNAFFAYNADDLDGVASASDCAGVNTYGEVIPAQSIQFLNKKLDYFTYYNNSSGGIPPNSGIFDPTTPIQIFNYMTGRWRDGTPFTYGGQGYNPFGVPFPYAFPDNPNDLNGWSMFQENLPDGDRRTIASYNHRRFDPNEIINVDIAYTFHQYSNISNHLEIVDQMYPEIEQIKQMYDMEFNSWCGMVTDTKEILPDNISISPNPSTGTFNLKTDNTHIESLTLFDISGRLLWQSKEIIYDSKELDFDFLNSGIYFLQIETKNSVFSKKLVVNK
jgi:type IX secretion system substrate protein